MAILDNSVRLRVIDHYFKHGSFENMSKSLLDSVNSDLSGRQLNDYLYSCLGLNFNSNFTMEDINNKKIRYYNHLVLPRIF